MRWPVSISVWALLAVSFAPAAERVPPTSLAECDARVRDAPQALESFSCYWFVGRNQRMLEPAARNLEKMLELDPGNPRIELYLGILLADLGEARAAELLREAAEGFAAEGESRGEVYARISLSMNHEHRGLHVEARRELDDALKSALASGAVDLEAQVRIQLAWRRYYAGEYGQARDQLDELQRVVFPDGSIYHRLDTLDAMAAVSWALGRHRAALEHYERMIELLRGSDPYRESTVRRNMALVARGLAADGRIADEELIAFEREALDAAIRGGNRLAEPGARLMLATALPGEEGLQQARRGLELARELGKPGDTCWGLWLVAEKLQKLDPEHPEPAFALAEEAIELARAHDDAEKTATGAVVRAKMRWRSGPRERAVAETLEALEAIERIRDLQPEGDSRARVFSRFADDYRWFAGALLESPEETSRSFEVIERMRARSLLETLDATGVATTMVGETLATSGEVQKHLQPNQALLSFQTLHRVDDPSDHAQVRSWVLVVTRAGATAVPLPDCAGLDRRVRLFLSLLERRDDSERAGAARLFEEFLADALARLPPAVDSLIVIPDGPLHHLPFGALVDPAGGRLAERFEITAAPSATAWIRLARDSGRPAGRSLVAFADPALPAEESRTGPRWRELLATDQPLQRLPGARREAEALRRHLGADGRVVTGEAATLAAVTSARLADYRLVHFAAHAVINDEHPERSAIVLDDLLDFGDVVELGLDGQVVVLSACRSASGPLIGGEGVIGLANAFFQAGAQSVVAGLWRVRDREAAALIERFGLHLGRGHSLAGAMALARRERIREGAPAAAWAGMVVLGNGDAVPFAGSTGRSRYRGPALVLVLTLVAVVAALIARRREIRARPRSTSP